MKYIIAILLGFSIGYGLSSFVKWDLNPDGWSATDRFFCLLVSLAICFAFIGVAETYEKISKK